MVATSDKKLMGLLLFFLATIILVAMFMVNNKQLSKIIQNEHFNSSAYELDFYSKSGCPHCDHFQPEWESLTKCITTFLSGEGRNCDVVLLLQKKAIEQNMTDLDKYGITGVPSVILKKPNGQFVQYKGHMKAQGIVKWLNTLLPCSITCVV